jgi:hypothetical protein
MNMTWNGKMKPSELPFAKTYKKNDLAGGQFSKDKSKIFLVYNVDGYDKPVMYDFNEKQQLSFQKFSKTQYHRL